MGAFTTASGRSSTAMGHNTIVRSFGEMVIGSFNTDYTPNSATTWNSLDRLFVVGNGSSLSSRSDALVILKNGNTGIGTSTPQYGLDVNGDSRVGWNGDSQKIYILPYDINHNPTSPSDVSLNNGASLYLSDGTDGWYAVQPPKGYKITGMYLKFNNSPDGLWATKRAVIDNSLPNVICPYCLTNETSPTGPYDINFGSSLTYNVTFDRPVDDDEYIYIQFSNTGTNVVDFEGGYLTIQRM